MCKHIHHTRVKSFNEDGTEVAIYQCDMCGLTMPDLTIERLAVDPADADLPFLDEDASIKAVTTILRTAINEGDSKRLIGYKSKGSTMALLKQHKPIKDINEAILQPPEHDSLWA